MATYTRHYVTFYSPGTLFPEQTTKPIDRWDAELAAALAVEIIERHGAKPYCFQFSTDLGADPVDDGMGGKLTVQERETARGGMYFLTGDVILYDDVPTQASILRGNMRCNRMPVVIENRNSYRFTGEFDERAVIVNPDGKVIRRGDDADLVEYRRRKVAEWDAERKAMQPA